MSVKGTADMMPWAMNLVRAFALNCFSSLPREDHHRYVSIVANFLQAEGMFRFEYNKMEIQASLHSISVNLQIDESGWFVQEIDEQLAAERHDFETKMIDSITKESTQQTPIVIPKGERKLFKVRGGRLDCNNHCQHINPRKIQARQLSQYASTLGSATFRTPIHTLPWVEPVIPGGLDRFGGYLKTVPEPHLQSGSLPFVPDLRYKCQIPLDNRVVEGYLRIADETGGPKTPIELDTKAQEMALVHSMDFIMDASPLKHLMVGQWRARSQAFAVKLVVSRGSHDGRTRRFFTLTKLVITFPLHTTTVTRPSMATTVSGEQPGDVEDEAEETKEELETRHNTTPLPAVRRL